MRSEIHGHKHRENDNHKVQLSSAVASQMRSLVSNLPAPRYKSSFERKQSGSTDNLGYNRTYQPQNHVNYSSTRIEGRIAANQDSYRGFVGTSELKREHNSSMEKPTYQMAYSGSSNYLNFAHKPDLIDNSYRRINRSNVLRESFANHIGTSRLLAVSRSNEFENYRAPKQGGISSNSGMHYNLLWNERSSRAEPKDLQPKQSMGRYLNSKERLEVHKNSSGLVNQSGERTDRAANKISQDKFLKSGERRLQLDRPNQVDQKLKTMLNDNVLKRAKEFLGSISKEDLSRPFSQGRNVSPLNIKVPEKPIERQIEVPKGASQPTKEYINLGNVVGVLEKQAKEEFPLMRRIKLTKIIEKIGSQKTSDTTEKDIIAMFTDLNKHDHDLLAELIAKLVHYKGAYESLKSKLAVPGIPAARKDQEGPSQGVHIGKNFFKSQVRKNLAPSFKQEALQKKGKHTLDNLEDNLNEIMEQDFSENFLSGDLTAKPYEFKYEKKGSKSVNGEKTKLMFEIDNDNDSILADLQNLTKE